MPIVDIAEETLKVGNALCSVRIDQSILNLAKGIAWGQYELDKVGVAVARMMGVPGTVSIGGENLSMLEAGFLPSFYHFVDTILELKMEVNIREEQMSSSAYKETVSRTSERERAGEAEVKVSCKAWRARFEARAKASWKNKNTSAYSRTVDASHSQKFSQDLSATSLMRTKIVPIPPPEILVGHIKSLLERLRKEAGDEAAEQYKVLFEITGSTDHPITDIVTELGEGKTDALSSKFEANGVTLGTDLKLTADEDESVERWFLEDGKNKYMIKKEKSIDEGDPDKNEIDILRVYKELEEEKKKSIDEILMEKVEDKIMESVEAIEL